MASRTGFCGDGCSFETVDIDCSMAFGMVEAAIRRIMSGLKERNGDEIVFAGLIKSNDAASVMASSQHRSSKFHSSVPTRNLPAKPSSSSQNSLSRSSSAPLLTQLKSVLEGLEELSLRGSPQAVSTPFAPPVRTRENTSPPANCADTSPTHRPRRRLSSPQLLQVNTSVVPSHREHIRRDLRTRAKANTFSSPKGARLFSSNEQAPSCSQQPATAGKLKHNQAFVLHPEEEKSHFLSESLEISQTHRQGQTLAVVKSHQASNLASRRPVLASFEHQRETSDIVSSLSHWFPSSMASESSEQLPPKIPAARRSDTPPRSIFDDYHSAYQGILSPGRAFSASLKAPEAFSTPKASSGIAPQDNPLANLSPPSHEPRSASHGYQKPGPGAAPKYEQRSRRPTSPKSGRRTNISRPVSVSPPSDEVTRPAKVMVRNSVSFFDLSSPRRLSGERDVNTKQPNFHGARGRVEKSSTIGSIVKKYGDESDTYRKSSKGDLDVEVRNSLDIVGLGPGPFEAPGAGLSSSPAGQPPMIPLPPDPSYVAARGLTGEILSEASLYENTEKLLNLTTTSVKGALANQTGSVLPEPSTNGVEGRLNSEFSWMGSKGKTSFRDLSTKELSQLRKSTQSQTASLASEDARLPAGDDSYSKQYLLKDAVYHSPTPDEQSTMLDEVVKADAWRAEFLSAHLATPSSGQPKGYGEVYGGEGQNRRLTSGVIRDPQTDSVLDFGGLQSSSSRGVSLEASLRDGLFRPELYVDESSLASLVGREDADAPRLSALAKGKNIIKSVEDDTEDELSAVADETEGGEWETVGESGMGSRLRTQPSIGRDTSGSSLANVSSVGSFEYDRSAPSPWDPLRSRPTFITPPSKAIIHPRSGHNLGVQEPATVPRYAPPTAEGHPDQKLRRTLSSTPALPFSATPQYQRKRQRSPTYRHPTPLSQQHHNPFSSSPPPVATQIPGASYELSELTNKGRDKRQAIYAESARSHQKNHKSTPEKTRNRLTSHFAAQDTSSDQSANGSYLTTHPTHLATDGTSILNPTSTPTPKSSRSYTGGSLKKTKTYFTASPRLHMSESRRYQRLRDEMGCGTGGIVRVPGMQQTAPPSAHIAEELIGPMMPYRAANPLPDLPSRNSFDLSITQPLTHRNTDEQVAERMIMANNDINILKKNCPTFPLNSQILGTFFRNKDGTSSARPKAARGTITESDGRLFEKAFCDLHNRWEFSHTPHLTTRIPKDDPKVQREMGGSLITTLFLSVVGWPFLVCLVAWDLGGVRDDMIREYSKGAVQTFHAKEVGRARLLTGVIVAVVAAALALVGVYL